MPQKSRLRLNPPKGVPPCHVFLCYPFYFFFILIFVPSTVHARLFSKGYCCLLCGHPLLYPSLYAIRCPPSSVVAMADAPISSTINAKPTALSWMHGDKMRVCNHRVVMFRMLRLPDLHIRMEHPGSLDMRVAV
ncbi:hypothetical protein GQ43DRAFT_167400 [Delitschia confertaspora ATCC 74209]|uniref:Uncharacterized protein n=1 Tax=Delitschia confertaspora ATCC 74209 TaxID=1513339 RepID=A0A9P4JWD1_9PLEO|nr:hypothetical protein GQ43DRAFT_167400 [Delitschia confertaspora ATCC 74209]